MKRGLLGLAAYLWQHRVASILGLVGLFLSDVAQLSVPMFSQRVIDALTAGTATNSYLATQAGLLLGMAILCYAARYAWRHFFFTAARLCETDIRRRLLDRVLHLGTEFYQNTLTGEVMALATNDVMSVRMALAFGLLSAFDSVVYAGLTLSALIYLDWRLTLWTFLPFPILLVIMAIFLPLNYRLYDKVQSAFEDVTEKSRESLAGMRVLRAYGQQAGDTDHFMKVCHEYRRRSLTYIKADAIYGPIILLLSGSSTAILVFLGGQRVISGQTSLGTFVAFSSYLGHLTWPMIAAGWMISLVQRGAASMSRIQKLLDQPPEPDQPPAEVTAQGALEARGLSFRYPKASRDALQDISFQVPAGGSLGLIGEVGSGKSTLTHLLSRLHDPPPGSLFLDGVDVLDYNLDQLRARISMVPQESFLFSQTIGENLAMGRPGASQAELEEVARVSSLHQEVLSFPRGYATELGERGVTLSGGQKQRLCLARALLKSAPVLVLDDTLSAVDANTEAAILEQLKTQLRRRTSLVISHRISSVKHLDHILVLDEGRIVQQGRHADLIAVSGLYREMYELQNVEEEPPVDATTQRIMRRG